MKRNLLTCVLCVLLAVPVLTGCGQQDSDSTDPSVSSASEQSAERAASGDSSGAGASDAEAWTENDKFNAAVFEQICGDIHIADVVVSIPGTLRDWGDHFSAAFSLADTENSLLTYKLFYDGTEVGYVTYDGDAELDEKTLETATFYSIFVYNEQEGIQDISIGGISISDSPDKVPEVLGEPTEYRLDDDGFGSMLYKIRDGYYLKFTQWDGALYRIGLSAHTIETQS